MQTLNSQFSLTDKNNESQLDEAKEKPVDRKLKFENLNVPSN